jgi:serine/threonine protein kinase
LVDGGLHTLDGGTHRWLATRYIEGSVVREVLRADGVSAPRVLSALQPLAAALEHLHARGVIHRDVAPGNVVLTTGGAVLIDYGQAVLADEPLASSAGVVGTPGYVAPEEVLEGPAGVTPAVDVYGLCAVGYAMLTGAPPAGGEHVLDALSRAARPPIPPRDLGVDVPEALEALLLQGLDSDPAQRPDAAGLCAALDAAEASLGSKGRA